MPKQNEKIIREAAIADVPAMANLATEFAQYMQLLGDQTDLNLNAEALLRDGFGARPAFQALVVEVENKVVGYLLYHDGYNSDEACRVVFVADLFISEKVRGRGIGTALISAVSAIAVEREAKQLVWTVDRDNKKAQHFYQYIGAQFVNDLRLMYLDLQ